MSTEFGEISFMAALLSFISKPHRLHFFLFGLNDAEVVITRIDQGNLEQIKAAQVCIHFLKQSANQRPRTKYILQFLQIQVCIYFLKQSANQCARTKYILPFGQIQVYILEHETLRNNHQQPD